MSSVTPQTYNGRYEINRLIARGGMAEVFLAHDLLLDRPVALKALFPELSVDHSFVERFRREAQAAANLSHPNIVSVYDWGQDGHNYFIVMELVEGRPLSLILQTEGALLADRAAAIGSDVAMALGFAHSHGVIHRDVKPGNVLITDDGQVKVTDFGIARAANASESLTQTGTVMGTATYFSPEQAQGMATDARSDVYSLGVVLYESVTRQPPFSAENPVSVAYKHVREAPVPPRQINPSIPAAFEAIILQAMAKDPADRYQNAQELRADLLRYQRGTTVLANPGAAEDQTQVVPSGDRTQALSQGDAERREPIHRRTRTYAILLLVLLIILGLVLYFVGKNLGLFGSASAPNFAVPALVGQSMSAATQTLSREGLNPKIVRANNPATRDTVFAQTPTPPARVSRGDTVTLDVSNGPGTVGVPNLVGQSLTSATAQLQAYGLKYTTVSDTNSSFAPGTVTGTNPPAGTSVPAGSTVTLQVASGPSQVRVPDVVGQSQAQAANTLISNGLRLGIETQQPSSQYAKGDVISSDPGAGSVVSQNTSVSLVISSGPNLVSVPGVVSFTQNDAQSVLSNDGFQVQVQTQVISDPTRAGTVISQNPASGAQVDPGSTVTITVGQSPTGSSTAATSPPVPRGQGRGPAR